MITITEMVMGVVEIVKSKLDLYAEEEQQTQKIHVAIINLKASY